MLELGQNRLACCRHLQLSPRYVQIALLIWFQRDLCNLRKRIATTNNYCFVGKEKTGFGIVERDEHPFWRGAHILAVLALVCVGGALLVLFSLK